MTSTASWTSKKPGRCGGNACVRDTRVPVWSLVERQRFGQSDAEILRTLPDLTADDLATAWEYAAAHPQEIERTLWENEACMVELPGCPFPVELVQRGRKLGLTDDQIRNAFYPPLSLETFHAALTGLGKA